MRAALVLFAAALAILLAPARAEVGRPRVAEGYAERVVAAGLLELPPGVAAPGRSAVRAGRHIAEVGPLDVAVALPGALLARISTWQEPQVARAFGGVIVPWLLFATIGSVFFARLHRATGLNLPLPTAIAGTFVLLFGTALVQGARRGDATLLCALALLLLVDELDARRQGGGKRHFVQLGLLGGTVALAEPAYAACALALVVLDVGRRVRGWQRLAVGAAVCAPILVALLLVKAWEARVALAVQPSGAPVHALYGILFSTGRSLFVYSPIAIVALVGFGRLWGRARGRAQAIAVAAVAALVVIAGRSDWHGDPAFGPTLCIPLLPLLVEPAVLALDREGWWRPAFIGFGALGVAVQLLGLAVDVEAWPRVVADLRQNTGAPGWFLDPAADIEFIPQLSPVVGQWTLGRIALGRTLPADPPFSLVVGTDQADVSNPPAIHAVWSGVRARIDRASLRPNLALVRAGDRALAIQLGLAGMMLAGGVGFFLRARDERKGSKGAAWRRG